MIISDKPTCIICNRRLTSVPDYLPHAIFYGDMDYFCTETCLRQFMDDKKVIIRIHKNNRKG